MVYVGDGKFFTPGSSLGMHDKILWVDSTQVRTVRDLKIWISAKVDKYAYRWDKLTCYNGFYRSTHEMIDEYGLEVYALQHGSLVIMQVSACCA